MNVYNLKRNDIFNTVNSNSTKDIDFNSPLHEYGIYDMKNYKNIRPILSEYLDDYNIIQTKDDYNKEILLQHNREQNEIAKNMGEISITRDPRITKYEDTYSITPYANFKIMDTTETDIDIVKSLDHCKGGWVNVDRCNINKPCKRILQEYIIKNPNYTGDHCREDRERVRDGDTRMIYCNDNKCNGHGKCNGYDVCSCEDGWGGDNCDVACPEKNCNNGVAIAPDCKCECDSGWGGDNCDECILIDNNCNNHGKVNHATCSCECDSGYSGPNCEIEPDSCNYPTQINCYNNGKCVGGICNCPSGYKGQNCEETISCSSVNPKYCGENGVVTGNVNDCKCICNAGYSGDRCNNIDKCDIPCINGKVSGYADNCQCICELGYTGPNCDTYDCSMLKDELNNYNFDTHQPGAHLPIEFSDDNKTLNFNINSLSGKDSKDRVLLYVDKFNKLIEQNLIEKILYCNKPTKIVIMLEYTSYFISIENIIMKIFDRISKYKNGEFLKYIKIYQTSIYFYKLNYTKMLSDISTKYYSEYKGKLRDINSDNILEFMKLPVISTSGYNFYATIKFKQNCPLTKKYEQFIKDDNKSAVAMQFPLEYFADCICEQGYTGPNCDIYDCSMLKDELIDFDKNYPSILKYYTNGGGNEKSGINDIINIDQITGVNLSFNGGDDYISKSLYTYKYIFENKILEKIFECCKNINYIYIANYSYNKELDDRIISIFDILKIYNLLNYVVIAYSNKIISTNINYINLLVTISKKYYDMPYRELIMTDVGYFIKPLLPTVYFVIGIDEHILTNNCLLKTKLKENVSKDGQKANIWYNIYIPFEYFKDC